GEIGIGGKKARIVAPQHAGAGTRWRHDVVEALKGFDDLPGYGDGVLAVAAIVSGLSAAGLRAGDLNAPAGGLNQLDRGECHIWSKKIDETGHEQADLRTLLRPGHRGHGGGQNLLPMVEGGSEDVASPGDSRNLKFHRWRRGARGQKIAGESGGAGV